MGLYTFLQKLFNSLKSFSVPLASAGLVAPLDIALSLVLKKTPLRVSGLAVCQFLSLLRGTIFACLLARRRLGPGRHRPIASMLGRSLLGYTPHGGPPCRCRPVHAGPVVERGTGKATS